LTFWGSIYPETNLNVEFSVARASLQEFARFRRAMVVLAACAKRPSKGLDWGGLRGLAVDAVKPK